MTLIVQSLKIIADGHTTTKMSGVVKSFGHVGVIVPDMAAARKHWTETLGVPTTEPKELCPGLLICFAEMPNAKIELIQPLTEDSEHGQWLKQHPQGGIHHLCLNTGKLEGAVEEVAKKGMKTDMKEPLVLSTGERVIFFNPDTTGGVLTEFYEQE